MNLLDAVFQRSATLTIKLVQKIGQTRSGEAKLCPVICREWLTVHLIDEQRYSGIWRRRGPIIGLTVSRNYFSCHFSNGMNRLADEDKYLRRIACGLHNPVTSREQNDSLNVLTLKRRKERV